tara:strand:- start:227 stop:439 length:213 start_codon:yes stop_codon:yes gene_type:complete
MMVFFSDVHARQAEVCDLDGAVRVHEDVAGLQVAMHHSVLMQELATTQDLNSEVLNMHVTELLIRSNNRC